MKPEEDQDPQNYQINVTVLEGRCVSMWKGESKVVVSIGDRKKVINAKTGKTDVPIYKESCQFQYYLPLHELMNKILKIRMYGIKTFRKLLIGICSIELGVVWVQPNHRFHHKWAALTDPSKPGSGITAYLKCDVAIFIVGCSPRTEITFCSGDNLEENLLVPVGGINARQEAKFTFSVFRADGFSGRGLEESFNDSLPCVMYYPYVRITFGGVAGKTSIVKSTSTPEWNEELVFYDMIPPLSQSIRVELCENRISSSATVLAYSTLSLRYLSFEGEKGFLPTYGPAFLYLCQQNQKKFCGETHMCRLLLALKTEVIDYDDEVKPDKKIIRPTSVEPLYESIFFRYDDFVLFAAVFDLLIFDKTYIKKNVSVRIAIGPKKTEREKEARKNSQVGLKYLALNNDYNTTPPRTIESIDERYGYVPYLGRYPCVHVQGKWPNFLERCERINVIEKTISSYLSGIEQIRNEAPFEYKTMETMKNILKEFAKGCEMVLNLTRIPEETDLANERKRVFGEKLVEIVKEVRKRIEKVTLIIEDEIRISSSWVNILRRYANDPQKSFPETEVWILQNTKPTGQSCIKTHEIIYTSEEIYRGSECGEIGSVKIWDNEGEIIGQLEMFLWFGLKSDIHQCEKMLAPSYKPQFAPDKILMSVNYNEKHFFQCRAHIYQARFEVSNYVVHVVNSLARVIVLGQHRSTLVKKGTLTPTWEETLIFPEVVLTGNSKHIKYHPPVVVIDVLEDRVEEERIGRCTVKPVVKLKEEKYEGPSFPPKLKRVKLFNGKKEAGDILVVIELLEITSIGNLMHPAQSSIVLTLPEDIKPNFLAYRMEVMFWGLRELKKFCWFPKLLVRIECGDNIITSSPLKNASKTLNFPVVLKAVELNLPQEVEYSPPLILKLYQMGNAGNYSFLGCNTIPNVLLFYHENFETEKCRWTSPERKVRFKALKSPTKKVGKEGLLSGILVYFKDKSKQLVEEVKEDIKEDENFDWWVKYYASKKRQSDGIAKFVVYENELEAQPEFKGFTDYLCTFDIFKGKPKPDFLLDENVIGKLKSILRLYKRPQPSEGAGDCTRLGDEIFSNYPISVIVRVYVVSGKIFLMGRFNPYVVCQLGSEKLSDRDHYALRVSSFMVGRCFQFEANFPRDYLLRVKVMHFNSDTSDDFIGETAIDLENRFYSKYRAQCGIPQTFNSSGYNAWRDAMLPTEILKTLCKESCLPKPAYTDYNVKIGDYEFSSERKSSHPWEAHALEALRNWEEIRNYQLVPEHVETRSLHNPSSPEMEKGKVELWVDIFPKSSQVIPPATDISVRKPQNFELRAIIWSLEDVALKTNPLVPEKFSDLYVQGWISDLKNKQNTDVYYSSTGSADFNWRFIFRFQYLLAENRIVIKKNTTEEKRPCKLELEVWDNDVFQKDCYGSLVLDLSKIPRGAKTPEFCDAYILREDNRRVNLFKIKKIRGWWPLGKTRDRKGSGDGQCIMSGKIDLELQVLDEEEAQEWPVGFGRGEPEALPLPNRLEKPYSLLTSSLKTLRYINSKIKRKYVFPFVLVVMVCSVFFFVW